MAQRKYIDERGKLIIKRISADILKKNKIISISDTGDMYLYTNGVYVFKPNATEDRIKDIIRRLLDKDWTKQRSAEAMEYIRLSTLTEREELNPDEFIINVKNGLYDVERNTLLEHDPSYLSTIQLNVVYDPDAQCVAIDKYLFEVVKPDHVPLLVQYAGYCCVAYINQERALILTGGMLNGKSTFINLITTMIGIDNASQQSLQALNMDRFARGMLEGRLINTYTDLPTKKLYDNSIFKLITSDPYIDGELKFGQKHSFKNTIHQIYSANTLPELENPDELAFFRRLLQIDFPNSFEGKSDSSLKKKLSTVTEIAGLFNIAMIGLRMLLHHDGFCEKKTAIEKQAEYLAKSDPVSQFVDQCSDDTEGIWFKLEFEAEFKKWCALNDITAVSKAIIGKKMKSLGYKYARRSDGSREYYWINISPKDGAPLDAPQTTSWTEELGSPGSDMLAVSTNPSKCLSNTLLMSKYKLMYYVYYIVVPLSLDAWTDKINRIGAPFEKST